MTKPNDPVSCPLCGTAMAAWQVIEPEHAEDIFVVSVTGMTCRNTACSHRVLLREEKILDARLPGGIGHYRRKVISYASHARQ